MFKTDRQKDAAILAWLHTNPGWQYGLNISDGAKLSTGSIYPSLARLCRQGWLEKRWDDEPVKPGGPRRMLYRVKPR